MRTLPVQFLLFIAICWVSCSTASDTDMAILENFPLSGFREPSGIVFHEERGTLFIVGDEGDLGEVSLAGILLRQQRIADVSFEGITINPETGLLYVAVEGMERIFEIHPETFEVLSNHAVERTFDNRTVLKENERGLEGITFVPDQSLPGGGSLFVTNQVLNHNDPEDLSGIFEISFQSIKDGAPSLQIASMIESQTLDLSGIFYNPMDRHFYIVSDSENRLIEMDRSGAVVATFRLPGETQEGITMDREGFIYIAQDAGGVLKLSML